MAPEMILVETHGKTGLIRLNRPQALNALCDQLMIELGTALRARLDDPRVAYVNIHTARPGCWLTRVEKI